jgi:hypothetical protein
MKTKFYSVVILVILVAFYNKSNAQANQSLSNLTSPTAVNVNLIPNQDNKRSLGTSTASWKNLYLDSIIYFHGKTFIRVTSALSWTTSVGMDALHDNAGSYGNTALGYEVMYSNTTGAENTATGSLALLHNTTGYSNTATGYDALNQNTTGYYNTAIGQYALYSNDAGSNNIADGYHAGYNVTDGSYNTFIGANANCGTGGHLTNSTAIGNSATVTTSNTVHIGNSSITSIGGYVNWSNISDGRVKKNIKQNVPGLAFINKLQPITYNLDLEAADKIIDRPVIKDKDARLNEEVGQGKIIQPTQTELTDRKEKEQIVYTGFIAQDVEKTAKELNYDFSGVDVAKNEHDLYGLRYAEFVVPLVKAVQELDETQNSKFKSQNDEITELKSEIGNLKSEIEELKAMIVSNQSTVNPQQSNIFSFASLEQNIPNPFNQTTTINYSLPQSRLGGTSAKIIVYDEAGKTVKSINLSGIGKGSINFSSPFRAGASYQYSLYVDDKLIGTKQMEHLR